MSVEDKNMFIEFTSKQLDRMEWLITTLLKYARIESNVVKYNKDTIQLNNRGTEWHYYSGKPA